MVLNRNPENYFGRSGGQSAFCPFLYVPGIELSADKLLQGRVFSLMQIHSEYRLGANLIYNFPSQASVPPLNRTLIIQRDRAIQRCATLWAAER